jgi:tungstate transport system ATP-binding protein
MSAPILKLNEVECALGGRLILSNINLSLGHQGITALVGANGAGKSTLLRLMHGLITPNHGEVLFEDRRNVAGDLAFAGQAMVFQRTPLIRASVLENLLMGIEAASAQKGQTKAERFEFAHVCLNKFGLRDHISQPAFKLSGGEQQRLALARAWALQPRLLLLDEPTAALDPSATEQVEQIIREFAEGGCKVVLSSHQLGQVQRLADDVLFLSEGQLAEHSAATNFLSGPTSDAGMRFLSGQMPWTTILTR